MGLKPSPSGEAFRAGHNGTIYWHEGKPIVSVKYTLWDGFHTPHEIFGMWPLKRLMTFRKRAVISSATITA